MTPPSQTSTHTVVQLAHFEVHVTAVDEPTERRRWNGDPMASEQASEALRGAVGAFRASLREAGFDATRVGYGVRASEVEL